LLLLSVIKHVNWRSPTTTNLEKAGVQIDAGVHIDGGVLLSGGCLSDNDLISARLRLFLPLFATRADPTTIGRFHMNAKTIRVLVVAGVLFTVVTGIVGWTTTKVVAWVRGLPNRVVIDGNAMANSFGQTVTESYHVALRSDDTSIQLQVLNEQFVPLIGQHDEGAAWIQNEYGDDIRALVDSEDPAVSAAGSNLVLMLDAERRP
jgi:hypothetical protein